MIVCPRHDVGGGSGLVFGIMKTVLFMSLRGIPIHRDDEAISSYSLMQRGS